MIRLVLILLGVDYLRRRSTGIYWLGFVFVLAGVVLLLDALDHDLYFPLEAFAALLVAGGVGALAVGAVSKGSLRIGRVIEGLMFVVAASLVLAGHDRGGFWLAMILGALFFVDGLLQCVTAVVIRYPRWRVALTGGVCEVAIAFTFFAPYPFGYDGTVPYALGLALMFIGWGMVWLAARFRVLAEGTGVEEVLQGALYQRAGSPGQTQAQADGGPGAASAQAALTVHVWLPAGAAQLPTRRRLLVDRYVAAVDASGAVWTGHVALHAEDGVYISLDPATPIKRSLESLRMLRAEASNNVPGHFRIDYESDAALRGPSTAQVLIRNYDGRRLQRFWHQYRQDETYNLTRRNCAVSVARALEAAVEGSIGRRHAGGHGWGLFFRTLLMPELWLAAQLRKRGKTMAWTPGLVLDYSRSLGVLVDPPAMSWSRMSAAAWRHLRERLPRGGSPASGKDASR